LGGYWHYNCITKRKARIKKRIKKKLLALHTYYPRSGI
jgi:hypothetical protein